MTTPLISAAELLQKLADRPPSLLDVRWELPCGARRDAYQAGHIPQAAFVDLERDLAAPPGAHGRHPLPDPVAFTAAMRAAGVSGDREVVVYDACGGLSAARAWWLLRYSGHRRVRVLDGGLPAWSQAGGPLRDGAEVPARGTFTAHPGAMPVLDAGAAAQLAARGCSWTRERPSASAGKPSPSIPSPATFPARATGRRP